MLCNQAPVLLDSASKSSGHATLNLEHFLSQYLPKNGSKTQTIHQTLQKAESHNFPINNKSDKSLTSKQVRFDKNLESTAGMSNKSSVTLDSSQKTSLDSSAALLVTIPKHEENIEENQNQAINPEKRLGLRKSKSKNLDRTKVDHPRSKKDRRITTIGVWSPYRSKSPIHNNTFTSFTSGDMNLSQFSQKSHLLIDSEHPLLSDEEENGGFLMIKPITPANSHPKLEQRFRQQNFNLSLDESLFPSEIIDYANSLQEENLGAYVRTLIGFIHSFRNKNKFFATKRPVSEALYSIYFQGETFDMFRKLLQQVLAKLKEESITLKQKYRSEIEYIETKHSKISRSINHSIKFEEKELQKLQAKITYIFQEKCLMDSQSALSLIHHFLEKILERFPSMDRPNALKPGKGVVIDHITLPKLMENLLDASDKSASFYRTIVIYTYDSYITAENLLLYLIQRYFDPEPRHMAASERRVYKAEVQKPFKCNILKIMKFWICERSGDFIRNRDTVTILNTFLDLAKPLEKDTELFESLNQLWHASEELSQAITKKKKRICEEVDDFVAPLQSSSFTHTVNKQDMSLLSRVISISEGPHLSLNRKDDVPKIKAAQSLTKMDSSSDSIAPFIMKTESSTSCQTVKDHKSFSNGSTSSLSGTKMTSVRSEADLKPVRSSLKPVIGNKFRFWTGSNGNKEHYDHKMLMEESSETIARYLTLIDWKHFAKIDISEMIKKRWTKGDKTECPNYFKYVARFNSFCSWIQYIVLSEENFKKRNEIIEKFLEVAVICLHTYHNYSSSHYIFAALSSLEKFDVISFQESSMSNYGDLKKTFIPSENFLAIYKEIFGNMKAPAIPNINFFLQSFLKLQDGVVFWIKLPESSKHRYLKFPLVVQINDSCKEMRRFQKSIYEHIKIQRGDILHKFLKKGFKDGVPIRLEERDEAIAQLTKMVAQVKEKQKKQFNFFGTKMMMNKGNSAF